MDGQNPVRVLNLFTILNRGGAETMVMNYYRHIDRTRVQFDFLVHREERGAYEDEIESLGGRIFRMMPNFVPRCFSKPGHRLRLHPDDSFPSIRSTASCTRICPSWGCTPFRRQSGWGYPCVSATHTMHRTVLISNRRCAGT